MTKAESLNTEHETLIAERTRVEREKRVLERQHEQLCTKQLELLAREGRGQAIDESEVSTYGTEIEEIERQLERKAAALAQIDTELSALGIQMEEEEHQGALNRLAALRDEYVEIAYELDTNPFDIDGWRRLREIAAAGNHAARRMNRDIGTPFTQPLSRFRGWFQSWGQEVEICVSNTRRTPNIKKPSDVLGINYLHQQLDRLLN